MMRKLLSKVNLKFIPVTLRKAGQIGLSAALMAAGAWLLYQQGKGDGIDEIISMIDNDIEPVTDILREDGSVFQFIKQGEEYID